MSKSLHKEEKKHAPDLSLLRSVQLEITDTFVSLGRSSFGLPLVSMRSLMHPEGDAAVDKKNISRHD